MLICKSLLLLLVAALAPLPAQVALLVGEPFGTFGALNPTGHAAIYLARVCAESPTLLRRCRPDEHGVVISRYARIAGRDWIAVPPLPYFYAVERAEDVPASVDASVVAHLRNSYRRARLQEVAPDGPEGETPRGDWTQLAGAAYDRTIYGFVVETTSDADDALIAFLNSRPNRKRFHLLYRNCADFARTILNFYYPSAVKRSIIADVGITTPKYSAKALVKYARRQPGLSISGFVVRQVPGLRRSTRLRGVSESLIRSKKYAAPLVALQPWIAGTAAVAYLTSGRFNPTRMCRAACDPENFDLCIAGLEPLADSGAGAAGSSPSGLAGAQAGNTNRPADSPQERP